MEDTRRRRNETSRLSPRSDGSGTAGAVSRALRENAPYVAAVAAYVIPGAIVLGLLGHPVPYSVQEIYRQPVVLTGVYLAGLLFWAIARDVVLARRDPWAKATWKALFERRLGWRRATGTLIVLATLPAVLDVMLGFRQSLTFIKPFTYDVAFMHLDAALHGGVQPWRLLQPVLGHPLMTVIVDRTYVYAWFLFMWTGTIWQAVHGREPVRLQFLLSFVLSWALLGTVAAVSLSSAGPAFFGNVASGPDPYVPLMAYLHSVNDWVPLHALANQERLWQTYRHWGGITAMPSMHLAITTIVALTAIRSHRRLAWIAVPWWLMMMLGSIHLGWHYAIDSYAGTLAAAAIWWLCGRFSNRWQAQGWQGVDRPVRLERRAAGPGLPGPAEIAPGDEVEA